MPKKLRPAGDDWPLKLRTLKVKGVQNHLADILSCNPSGLTDEQTRDMTRPDQVRVHHIQVYRDYDLKKELTALAELQDMDEKITAIKNGVTKGQPTDQTKFVL
jgi:hypothetical protein